jgi:uncharacterized membrane protein YjjP (DUF1212 family)
MDVNKLVHLTSFAGEIMLENGAETYRVEETIERMCNAYAVQKVDSFVTPTGIMISITDVDGKIYSKVTRVRHRKVDLDKISKLNDLSRQICSENISLDIFENYLVTIKNGQEYERNLVIFCSSISAGFFTLLFGGDFNDFCISMVIGFSIQVLSSTLSKIGTNSFFINAIGGAVSSFIALASTTIHIGHNTDKIVIGSLMLLVPGLVVTNAIRDTIAGDLVAGTSRIIEAFLIAIAIAVGSGLVFSFWISYFGGGSI